MDIDDLLGTPLSGDPSRTAYGNCSWVKADGAKYSQRTTARVVNSSIRCICISNMAQKVCQEKNIVGLYVCATRAILRHNHFMCSDDRSLFENYISAIMENHQTFAITESEANSFSTMITQLKIDISNTKKDLAKKEEKLGKLRDEEETQRIPGEENTQIDVLSTEIQKLQDDLYKAEQDLRAFTRHDKKMSELLQDLNPIVELDLKELYARNDVSIN